MYNLSSRRLFDLTCSQPNHRQNIASHLSLSLLRYLEERQKKQMVGQIDTGDRNRERRGQHYQQILVVANGNVSGQHPSNSCKLFLGDAPGLGSTVHVNATLHLPPSSRLGPPLNLKPHTGAWRPAMHGLQASWFQSMVLGRSDVQHATMDSKQTILKKTLLFRTPSIRKWQYNIFLCARRCVSGFHQGIFLEARTCKQLL